MANTRPPAPVAPIAYPAMPPPHTGSSPALYAPYVHTSTTTLPAVSYGSTNSASYYGRPPPSAYAPYPPSSYAPYPPSSYVPYPSPSYAPYPPPPSSYAPPAPPAPPPTVNTQPSSRLLQSVEESLETLAPQPGAVAPQKGAYSTGLFSVFADMRIAVLGCLVPCYLSAKAMGELQGRDTVDLKWLILGTVFCCPLCNVIELWLLRHRVQKANNIHESCLMRMMAMCFFSSCALCQDAREVRIRRAAAARGMAGGGAGAGARSFSATSPLLPVT